MAGPCRSCVDGRDLRRWWVGARQASSTGFIPPRPLRAALEPVLPGLAAWMRAASIFLLSPGVACSGLEVASLQSFAPVSEDTLGREGDLTSHEHLQRV